LVNTDSEGPEQVTPQTDEERAMNQLVSCELLRPQTFFMGVAPEKPQDADSVLALAAASGAPAAISELYERHYPRVYALCMRMMRNRADAEDLTQEVFIQLLLKIGSFRGESLFTTWLHRLTINQVLMHFRRRSSRPERPADDAKVPQLAEPGTEDSGRMPVFDKIALNAAVAQLPPGCRTVFLLFDVEGREHKEVAKLLGCSVGNSKSQLHKARQKLRRLLQSGRAKRKADRITSRGL